MPERAVVTQGVQVGLEVTPGTAVAANKQFNSIGIGPAVQLDVLRFRPMGQKFASMIVPGREWVQASLTGVGSYQEIAYFLSSLIKKVTGTQQAATTAYLYSFVPAPKAEDTVQTFSVEQGGAVRAHKFAYGLVNELTFGFSRGGVEIGGNMIGQRLTDNVTLTPGPTNVAEVPIIPTEIDVFIDNTFATIGTTKMTRVLQGSLSMGSRFAPVWVLDSSQQSFVSHVETEPAFTLALTLEADTQGMAILTDMRAGSTKYIRIKCTSPQFAGTAIPYSLTFDMAGKVNAISDFSDQDGVYAVEWTYEAVYDSTAGFAIKIDNINKLATL